MPKILMSAIPACVNLVLDIWIWLGIHFLHLLKKTQILPYVENTAISPTFNHIFSGGYAAGYYSYKWAEVLDADAFSVFEKNGIFDQATAQSFMENILKKGGTEHPMILYKRFRGQEPSIDALLRRNGIISTNN